MRVLFIGGTGIISSACTQLAAERGVEIYVLNRGRSWRPIPDEVIRLMGDIRDQASAREAIGALAFDAVVDWVAFTPEHVETDLELKSKEVSSLNEMVEKRDKQLREMEREVTNLQKITADYKPKLDELHGKPMPESFTKGQPIAGA